MIKNSHAAGFSIGFGIYGWLGLIDLIVFNSDKIWYYITGTMALLSIILFILLYVTDVAQSRYAPWVLVSVFVSSVIELTIYTIQPSARKSTFEELLLYCMFMSIIAVILFYREEFMKHEEKLV